MMLYSEKENIKEGIKFLDNMYKELGWGKYKKGKNKEEKNKLDNNKDKDK